MNNKIDEQIERILEGRKYYKSDNSDTLREGIRNQIEKTNNNIEILENTTMLSNKYPYLFKLIKNRRHYLQHFLSYSKDKVINYRFKINGNYVFFVSNRYLAKRYKKDTTTWNRNINIFATLGLVDKHNIENFSKSMVKRKAIRLAKVKAKKLEVDKSKIKPITYYKIPLYDDSLLSYSNKVAKIMIDNNFRANGFSKMFLIKVFGQAFADTIFKDERYVTKYSDYVSKQIEKFILNDISVYGYTTKDRTLKNTYIDAKNVTIREYGFYRQIDSPKHILSREFDRTITVILKNNNLEYRKANKELKEKFELDGYKTIIYKLD